MAELNFEKESIANDEGGLHTRQPTAEKCGPAAEFFSHAAWLHSANVFSMRRSGSSHIIATVT